MNLQSPQKIADKIGRSRQWVLNCCADGTFDCISKNNRTYIDADRIGYFIAKLQNTKQQLQPITKKSKYTKFLFRRKNNEEGDKIIC